VTHAIETIHDGVQDGLRFFLFADKVVEVGKSVIRLVSLTVLFDETVDVLGNVISVPRN
jgi:hypothetical protein